MIGLVATLVLASGCGKSDPPLLPVTGVVLLDGQPAAAVDITFAPKDGGNELCYRGRTRSGPDGAFTVMNATGSEGLPAGEYIVTFSKLTTISGSELPSGSKAEGVGVKELLPKQYTHPDSSPESLTVKTPGARAEFKLVSK